MKNFSTTFAANIVSILVFVLPVFGVHVVNQGTLAATVASIIGVISTLYIFYGRYRAGGINSFGIRK